MDSQLRIIVTGLIAQHPQMGGVAWDYVQYAAGLRRLGHDVYYFEDSGEWPYRLDQTQATDDWIVRDPRKNLDHLHGVLDRFGLGERWAYRFPYNNSWYGLSDLDRRRILDSADLVINVSGTIEHPDTYRRAGRLAYIDSDPLFTQVKVLLHWKQGHLTAIVDAHDVHFSFGENASSGVPDTGHDWLPTRHPMLLEEWPPGLPCGNAFTTVMNWTSYEPVRFGGQSYGQKDVEFIKFLRLPSRLPSTRLEIALAKIARASWQSGGVALAPEIEEFLSARPDAQPADLLVDAGWTVVDPDVRCGSLDDYRDFIVSSMAEWSVAKNGYVASRSGWFSCRSACYLAASRPVVVQDTGFGDAIPTGEGVLTFCTLDEAVAAIEEVQCNYERHSIAARSIAEEYFDSQRVLSHLVERAMNYQSERHSSGAAPTA